MTSPRVPSRLELALDRFASPTLGPRRWGAYFVCGFCGYMMGLTLVIALAIRANFGVTESVILVIVPPTTLLLAIRATVRIFGHERIVFYEKALLTIGASALAGFLLGGRVAELVDLVALGVGTFLAFGRIGCFRVACCHGRATRHGVAYRHSHAELGLPSRLIGVRLLPIQLLDSVLSGSFVVLGVTTLSSGAAPGSAACLYAAGYGLGRFALEFVRGDAERPRAGGISEAQWTALATAFGAALWHPRWWSLGAFGVLLAAVAILIAARCAGTPQRLWLTSPRHIDEIATHLERFAIHPGGPITTKEGLRLSAACLPDGCLDVIVSRSRGSLSTSAVQAIARQLGRPWTSWRVIAGRTPGLVHLVFSRLDSRLDSGVLARYRARS